MDLNNPRTASVFNKFQKPLSQVDVYLQGIGIYGLPEQFFSDADLTSFEYRIYFAGEFNAGGEVKKRLKTEEEVWKEEQFKLNKGKKRKKDEEIPKEELEKLAYFEEINRKD